ncbi:MAG: ferric reductase-like transmembrane domain-containing protein [Streptosporangiaceae bacterium]
MTSASGQLLVAAGAGPSPLWYATRATGVVAFILLTATVALGVAGTARFAAANWPRVVTAGLHRNISLLAVGFVVVHVLTTVADSYVSIGLASALLPFTSSYRPLWLSLGTVAFDLMLAVVITSLLRDRLGYRAWRAVHWLAYASWPVALWHALGTGTDSRLPWLLGIDAVCLAAVAGAVIWRLADVTSSPARLAALGGVVAVPLATALFVLAGPLQPGWAVRAGTPAKLLGSTTAPASGSGSSGTGSSSSAVPALHDTPFRGRARRTPQPGGLVTITVSATTSGARPEHLQVVLHGSPAGAGVSLAGGNVRIGRSPSGYAGPVTSLNGQQLAATLHAPDGSTTQAHILLAVHGTRATGQISTGPAADS